MHPSSLKFVETLLQARGAQSACDSVNEPVELSGHLRELAFFVIAEGVVFTALEIDLFLNGSHKLLNELWRHQALPQAIDDQSL